MTQPYSEDLRERALARADAGDTVRSIAEALRISPSCISKWKKLRRETGSLKPGKMNGHKKRTLSGANADWLRQRIRSGPFTSRKLTAELAARLSYSSATIVIKPRACTSVRDRSWIRGGCGYARHRGQAVETLSRSLCERWWGARPIKS